MSQASKPLTYAMLGMLALGVVVLACAVVYWLVLRAQSPMELKGAITGH